MNISSDIDIDCHPNFTPEDYFPWTRASTVRNAELISHPCGVYPQTIPVDSCTKLAAIPYVEAEEMQFVKIDFLHLNFLSKVTSRQELKEMASTEPDWSLLLLPSVHPKLFQLSKHGELLCQLQPTSVIELADALALIRPGKSQLLGLYLKNKEQARKMLWAKDTGGYSFKKSHGVAYALNVVIQLHLIAAGRL